MDLFESGSESLLKKRAPLADRMRPETLDQFVGQNHIIGRGRLLRRAIEIDQLSSIILYGPPGTGKTTLARIIANTTMAEFITINAVLCGVKDIRAAIETAQNLFNLYSRKTILFVDEVHRFNKSQQDALLPHVESGTITLIGATTENPYFEVNKALVSRSRIFQLRSLDKEDLKEVVSAALTDDVRGYGGKNIHVETEALEHLCETANGDARTILNALELAVETTSEDENGKAHLTKEIIEESIQKKAVLYDKDGDAHYDIISAFIKSVRGSDPDAALYWLAKMIYAGEDPRFILRRMVILATEDIGLADPNALTVVMSAVQAYDYIGMPEGRFPLSQACIYLATAPKSNTTLALFDALQAVEKEGQGEVPDHLKDSSRDRKGFGHGEGYLYPHAYRDHWVAQQYLPGELQGKMFYNPSDQGYEKRIREDVERRRETQIAALVDAEQKDTFLWQGGENGRWEQRTGEARGSYYEQIRDKLFNRAAVQQEHLILDLNCQSGFFTFESLRRASAGGVWSIARSENDLSMVSQYLKGYSSFEMPELLLRGSDTLESLLVGNAGGAVLFDRIIGRNLLDLPGGENELHELRHLLHHSGEIHLSELISSEGSRLHNLVESHELREVTEKAEEILFTQSGSPDKNRVFANLAEKTGFDVAVRKEQMLLTNSFSRRSIDHWFRSDKRKKSLGDVIAELAGERARDELYRVLLQQLLSKEVPWYQTVAFVRMRYK